VDTNLAAVWIFRVWFVWEGVDGRLQLRVYNLHSFMLLGVC
jgi:hypothetical protein